MSKVLIVDDERSIRITLCEFLKKEGFEAEAAEDVPTALQMIESGSYDVIVTDIIMPRLTGMDLLKAVREKSNSIQVLVMTGEPTVDTAIQAVHSGANDYLTKPIARDFFVKSIRHAAQLKQLNDEKESLEMQNRLYQMELEDLVEDRTAALHSAMQGSISLLTSMIEVRDPYTAGHQRRVGNLSAVLAEKMGMDDGIAELLRIIGYIHDLGKIVIPAEILSKPGALSPIEWEMIRQHAFLGYEMISKVDLPDLIGQTILAHHERINGSGYPRGLKGGEICMEAQVLMVADVVESMTSHRPYRPARGLDAALEEIQKNSGVLYNPEIVSVCVKLFRKDDYAIDDTEHRIHFPILKYLTGTPA